MSKTFDLGHAEEDLKPISFTPNPIWIKVYLLPPSWAFSHGDQAVGTNPGHQMVDAREKRINPLEPNAMGWWFGRRIN